MHALTVQYYEAALGAMQPRQGPLEERSGAGENDAIAETELRHGGASGRRQPRRQRAPERGSARQRPGMLGLAAGEIAEEGLALLFGESCRRTESARERK